MKEEKETFILDFLKYPGKYFLEDNNSFSVNRNPTISIKDFVFYKVERITFEEKAPRKEALENVLCSMRIPDHQFIYLVKGDKKGVSFYYGISKDLINENPNTPPIAELGQIILKPCLEGNFQGSKIQQVDNSTATAIMKEMEEMKYMEIMDGVPGLNEDNEKYQGADRLVNVMQGNDFIFLVVAKPIHPNTIFQLEKNVFEFYDKLTPLAKRGLQKNSNSSKTEVDTRTTGKNTSHSETTQNGTTKNFGKTLQESRSSAKPASNNKQETRTESQTSVDSSQSWQENSGKTSGDTTNEIDNSTTGTNTTAGESTTSSYDFVNKDVQEWLKYIEDVLLKRLDYGKGKGLFVTCMALFANSPIIMQKLSNSVSTLYSNGTGNKVALKVSKSNENSIRRSNLKKLQVPIACFNKKIEANEIFVRTSLSQYATAEKIFLGNWLSVNELAIIAGIPQKEVVGLTLREEVEFGLNYKNDISENESIHLGKLVQSGKILDLPVFLDKKELNKHTFVTGVTGSGKTTTCQKILVKSTVNTDTHFLVIEPAKTEYRILKKKYNDILVYTLGNDSIAPFRLNPFEFYEHESISSHVDMIKASIESAFDMEAAIPQIIEKSIYECYKDCGWDLTTNQNLIYKNPFADGVYAFPTLSELVKKTEEVVSEQGFDARLKNDYIGSIKARLQGLLIGAKGLMLNTRRSVDFRDLVHRNVILEIEDIRSGSEKSLIMGFVLSNLIEAIKAEYLKSPDFTHITLVEEAHRLFSKFQLGDSQNKKQSVEIFSDMLAEVRKYGESLIIVDQIPEKMTPEVLKNTNTKIVHKIFAKDDKDAIGNTMALSDKQKQFLSFLDKGRAIVFSQGWDSSIQVQITPEIDTSESIYLDKENIRHSVIEYYCDDNNYKRGIFPVLSSLQMKPSIDEFERCLLLDPEFNELIIQYRQSINRLEASEKIKDVINHLSDQGISLDHIARYISGVFYLGDSSESRFKDIQTLLQEIKDGNNDLSRFNDKLTSNIRRQ